MAPSTKMDLPKGPLLLLVLNIVFAVLSVVGQVGQNVSLPLWIGSTGALYNPNCSHNTTSPHLENSYSLMTELSLTSTNHTNHTVAQPFMDAYFVLSFASLSFVVIFGVSTAVLAVVQVITNAVAGRRVVNALTMQDDLLFPQWQLLLIGVFDALNGVFVVFASDPKRTAPFLQAILGNFTIPFTIFFRYGLALYL